MKTKKPLYRTGEPGRAVGAGSARIEGIEHAMGEEDFEDEGLRDTARMIRRMPSLDPPDILLHSIMASVRSTKLPLWTRILRWFKSPHSITITPLRAFPVAAALLVACVAVGFHIFKSEPPGGAHANGRTAVVLALSMPGARSVAVIGSFNDWRAQNCELSSENGKNRWTITLSLPAGRYEYAFLVDGEKIIPDPFADLREDDGFGNQNTILLIGNGHENSV